MAIDLRLMRMPADGLYRAGRWADVDTFPPPAGAIEGIFERGPLLIDGYPRWEDAYGQFSTAKLSASPEAAIGRTLAGYRRYEEDGVSMIDKIKGFFNAAHDNESEPPLIDSTIPTSYFEDAYRLHLAFDDAPQFIDVEHQRTRNTLSTLLAGPLGMFDTKIDEGLSQNRDRRVTRLVMSTLYDLCRDPEYEQVVGIRYKAPEPHWDAYVLWRPPERLKLGEAESVSPIFPDEDDLLAAAGTLGLKIPRFPES